MPSLGIESVLVAGRGPAACAVVSACARLGVKSVAVHSEAERSARHVRLADDAALLGPPPAAESYLAVERIVEIAGRQGPSAAAHVREWLPGQAAGGYVAYDPASGRYSLTEEQAFLLADTAGMQAAAAFHIPVAVAKNIERITEAVRTGGGFPWHHHDPALFEGVERVVEQRGLWAWAEDAGVVDEDV